MTLEGILRAEDRRAREPADSALLLRGLASSDTLLLRRAVRALGRLERPALAAALFPLLAHPLPGVRAETITALAQAAQGWRRDGDSATRGTGWTALRAALERRVSEESDPAVRGTLALSLGRLPYATAEEIGAAREAVLRLAEGLEGEPLCRAARGLGLLARLTARRLPLGAAMVARLAALVTAGTDPCTARAALAGLLAAQAAGAVTLERAAGLPDRELRRLAMNGAGRFSPGPLRERLLQAGLADADPRVRLETLGALARAPENQGCGALTAATRDSIPSVALTALDLLGGCGGDSAAVTRLERAARATALGWQGRAHALVSLARVAPARAAALLAAGSRDPTWEVRMYAARAAALLLDSARLRALARDPVANVRDAAVTGLRGLTGHADDSLYRRALGTRDYQLVISAAGALAGSPERGAASAALLAALERLTRDRRDTSRDPRVALLVRLRELGTPSLAPRLIPLLRDFDPVVADSAAALRAAWTGQAQSAEPRPEAVPRFSLAELERLRGKRLRVTLGSGARFEVELFPDEAPLTVLRVARLAARGGYDGLSFHRVVPNFVIQGGSPGANEYAGHDPYLRDELGPRSHQRGTLGISTRGRDTGDAQLFVNLVDNLRLDFEYTVWGRVVAGLAAVDAVREGERIRRVELWPR
ncbi:MAG TPA: peptidylprolyl isomerase [Gemmatimonadales bacterium]|nr:peptidylprolyl isomerase [Gemmatimonadales bacterium]